MDQQDANNLNSNFDNNSLYELLKTYAGIQMQKTFQNISIPKLPVLTTEEGIKQIKQNSSKNISYYNSEDFKLNGDFIESQAFAYLAIRSYLKKNISFPSTGNTPLNALSGLFANGFAIKKFGDLIDVAKSKIETINSTINTFKSYVNRYLSSSIEIGAVLFDRKRQVRLTGVKGLKQINSLGLILK